MSQLGGVLSKLVHFNSILHETLGVEPAASWRFLQFFTRNALFSNILISFQMFLELLEKAKLLKLKNLSKELNFLSPSAPLIYRSSPKHS